MELLKHYIQAHENERAIIRMIINVQPFYELEVYCGKLKDITMKNLPEYYITEKGKKGTCTLLRVSSGNRLKEWQNETKL